MKKGNKLKWFGVIFILCLFFLVFRVYFVLNAKTGLPIHGAEVDYEYNSWAGCNNRATTTTNFLGMAIFFNHSLVHRPFPGCSIRARANGFHENGKENMINPLLMLPLRFIVLPPLLKDRPVLEEVSKTFTKGEGMDVLTYLVNTEPTKNFNNLKKETENDFVISNIQGRNATISFSGEGGVIEVSNEIYNNADHYAYPLEHMSLAPKNGYQKELIITTGKSYVARLRDGKHHIKFYNAYHGIDSNEICIRMYANRSEGRNVDFEGIGHFLKRSCGENKNDKLLPLKEKYAKLVQDFSQPFTITRFNYNSSNGEASNGHNFKVDQIASSVTPGAYSMPIIKPDTNYSIQVPSYESVLAEYERRNFYPIFSIPVVFKNQEVNLKGYIVVRVVDDFDVSTTTYTTAKAMCDLNFHKADLTNPYVKQNYDNCVQFSFIK